MRPAVLTTIRSRLPLFLSLCACVATKLAREASFLGPVIGMFGGVLTWNSFPYTPTIFVWERLSQEAKQEFVDFVKSKHPIVLAKSLLDVLNIYGGESLCLRVRTLLWLCPCLQLYML